MKPKLILLQLVMVCVFMNTALSQDFYTGVWRQGSGGTFLWGGVSWSEFNSKWSELAGKNLRLINIKTYAGSRGRLFTGIWSGGSDGYALTPTGLDWGEFNKFWDDYSKKGQRLINVETYVDGGKLYFLGVFRAGNDGYALTPLNLDWAEFNKFWDENSKKGLRLINIESYMNEGKRYFLGVFRSGSGGYVLSPYGKDWNQFKSYWGEQARNSQRLIDIETFTEGGKRIYLGVWREGSDGHYLWGGVDFESLNSKFAENNTTNLRLVDLETYDISSIGSCLNDVLMPKDQYDYEIFAGPQHCEGQSGTCPSSPVVGSVVTYRWPNLNIDGKFYVRNSVLFDANDQIFTLPFKAPSSEMGHNAWLYSDGTWHHAFDYWRSGSKTFEVCAAAPGKVIYIGWDNWSGGTIIMSHDADGKRDVYRTIYMHLQNGPDNDCENAWVKSYPSLSSANKTLYSTYLKNTGCPLEKKDREPKPDFWGTDAKKIDMSLLNKTVSAGQVIGWSGSTGPGGCGCMKGGSGPNTHLHIFFAHRDPTDDRWYFIDPYGIYSHPDNYPKAVDGTLNTACARYPITWKGGTPKYAQ